MRLEHPAALALALLILLLLFTKRRRTQRRLPVANLYLWNDGTSSNATALARRLRRHWLVIVQAAFLAAVALAIAQPIVPSRPRTVAIILDRSVSMGAREGGVTRFDLARADVLSAVQRLPGNTRVRLIAADANPQVLGEFNASDRAIPGALNALRVTDGAADVRAALDHARAGDVPPQRIYVFTDADAPQPGNISPADVEWWSVGRPADNAAITGLTTRRLPTNRTQVLLSMSNHGTAAVTADVTLSRDRSELARQPVTLLPGSSSALSFTVDDATGVLTASLEHDDALGADNVRRLVTAAPTIRVLVTARNDSFLQRALSVHRGIAIVESGSEAHDVVVCDGCTDLPNGSAAVLLIPPRSGVPQSPVALAKVAVDHPLADGLNLDGTSGITLAHRPLPEGSTVIAQGGGFPVLAAYEAGGRRVIELRVDPDQGPLPYSSAFPVLVANAVEWLAGAEVNALTLTAGEPLAWQLPGQRRPPVVSGPDGERVDSTFNNGMLSVTATNTAGIYRVTLDSGDRIVAFNPAVRGEADLALPSGPARVDATGRDAVPAVPMDVTSIVVLMALVLLAAEWRYRLAGKLA